MIFHSDTTKTGVVTSPGYPNPYPARSTCRYDFQGRGKERVQIIFQDFNLFHSPDDLKGCDGVDSMVAFVHIEGKMEKIDAFCGTAPPRPIMSNGARLLLEFRGVQSSRQAKGFKATYLFTERKNYDSWHNGGWHQQHADAFNREFFSHMVLNVM
ncbi:hypothetical protein PV325_007741 [Microctonus aethiopoides]|nr:hypothetical protein PV325_007741 [Microctonus aethiopoides]KAK0095793.1 hypothetical protein PV326_007374 [Microctonus aethiopoides]